MYFALLPLFGYSQIPTINEKFIDLKKINEANTEDRIREASTNYQGEINIDSLEIENFSMLYDKKIDSISTIIKTLLIYQKESTSSKEKMILISEEIEMQKNLLNKIKKEKNHITKTFSAKKQKFFPTSNNYYRDYFFNSHYSSEYNKTALLTSLSATINKDAKTIQSELVADRIKWFRVSLGSVMSIASDTTNTKIEADNIERLISGGGNFYLDFTLPVFTTYTRFFFNRLLLFKF